MLLLERQAKAMRSGFQEFSVVIPAYNEAGRIAIAILDTKDVLGEQAEIIVVDDGSTDSTSLEAEAAGATVLRHQMNRGKGAAVKMGALASTGEWLLVLDADLSTHPRELEKFRHYFNISDLLIGSRRMNGALIPRQQPWYRVQAGQVFNLIMRKIIGLPYRDTQCGFKAFRMEVCRPIFEALTTNGWSFDVELLLRAKQAGLRITELPITWNHASKSKVKFRHALRTLSELWRLRRVIPEDSLDDRPRI